MDTERFDRLRCVALSAAARRGGCSALGAPSRLSGGSRRAPRRSERGRGLARRPRRPPSSSRGQPRGQPEGAAPAADPRSAVARSQRPWQAHRPPWPRSARHRDRRSLRTAPGLGRGSAGRCAAPTGGGLGSGTSCLPSGADLQAAIDAALSGDTLTLCAGTFVDVAATISKNLTLVGAGTDQTILNNDAWCICAVIEVGQGRRVTVQGLAIVKRDVSYWGFVNYGTLTLSEVTITGGGAPANGAGIYNEGSLTLGAGASILASASPTRVPASTTTEGWCSWRAEAA